jgi:uncharacterized protein YllA (UPF0747 family)
MPVAVPRAGFTLFDARSAKLMDRYGLTLKNFFHGEEPLRERIAQTLVPAAVNAALSETASAVDAAVVRLRADLLKFDPTLAAALDRSGNKIRYQIDKIQRKTGREALRRSQRASQEATSLYGLVYPDRTLQERLYSILPFLAKHGLDLTGRLYEAIELDCPDHRLISI